MVRVKIDGHKGHDVTVFERMPKPDGMPSYGTEISDVAELARNS